jgi:hypothetical protein
MEMKYIKITVLALFVGLMVFSAVDVDAQCAMCSATAEAGAKNGNTEANGLNNGIMYLLAAPYLAVAIVGYVWYKKYRRKNVDININNEKLHLN